MASITCPPHTARTDPVTASSPRVPARIVLAPDQHVLPVGADALRFGIQPATALALESMPPALADLVLELTRPAASLEWTARAMAAGVPLEAVEHVLTGLLARGRLVDATASDLRARRVAGATVAVRGRGPLADAVAADLRSAGVGIVLHGADPPVRGGNIPEPDVVVLAGAPVVGREEAGRLLAERVDHLLVAVHDGVGAVGPFALPGRTTCLSCLDLARTDADPDWPVVAARLCSTPGSLPAAALVAATAALAAEQVVQVLQGAPAPGPVPEASVPESAPALPERCPVEGTGEAHACCLGEAPGTGPPAVGAILEVDLRRARVRRIAQQPHPDCPCGAAR